MAKDPIKKADNGTYYFRANLSYNPITGKQIQKYRSGFRTKKEAKEEYSKLVLASTEELTTKKDGVSFQQFIEETYLPWYKTQVKESTYLNRATTIKKHFSYFYKMETDEIEPIHVQNWQLKLAKDFSPNYIRIVQGMLSIAFDRAIVLGIAKKNPSRMIGNIKSKKTKVDFWTLEEFQKVISLLCKKDYYEHYLFISFWLLFMTGMRIGEASALHWSDIDFETGLLSITKTLYYRTMTDYKFVEPKTQASIRTIYIDSDTLNELKAWQSVQQQVLPDCPLVLSYNGTPTSKTTLHYYDEIGLLKPTQKSDAGYRLYDDRALEILQQILFFREFDIPLKEIKAVLENPALERNQILQMQRKMLVAKKERMEHLIASIDDILKGENKMDFAIFSKTEVEEMFQTMFEHMPDNMKELAVKEFGSIEEWKKHYIKTVSSEEMQKGYAKVVEWYGGKEQFLSVANNPISKEAAESYNQQFDNLLYKLAAKKVCSPDSSEVRELVSEYGFLMKQLSQIKKEHGLMVAQAQYYRNEKIKPMIDEKYGNGTAEFFAQAFEAFYKDK